ncbi:hypothetical protein FSP39_024255 [Pinctada imbricata]|uniref:YqaJ viral recombinase domain-containing protein n=1 Tax=Pinctada imbricata TaxID=66713 RepID=A0AA89BP94_PINIB|nr:hypothetical protein FSP39_024255 [Pinctada imbricata]
MESESKIPHARVEVNGELEVNAIVGTGSSVTLISNRVYDRLSRKPKVKGHTEFGTAGGSVMLTEELEAIPLRMDKFETKYVVYKGDIVCDMILGLDLLSRAGAVISFDTSNVKAMAESTPLSGSGQGQVDPKVSEGVKEEESPPDDPTKFTQVVNQAEQLSTVDPQQGQKVRPKEPPYEVSDVVYIKNPKVRDKGKKGPPPWIGPGVIRGPEHVEIVSPKFDVQVLHRDNVKPFQGRSYPPWVRAMRYALQGAPPLTRSHSDTGTSYLPPTSAVPPTDNVKKKVTEYVPHNSYLPPTSNAPLIDTVKKKVSHSPQERNDPWGEPMNAKMVSCDLCNGWFHPKPRGTTREYAESLRTHKCPPCFPSVNRAHAPLTPAIIYGQENEKKALESYIEKNPQYTIDSTGLWINPKYPGLGCSPDGIFNDTQSTTGLIEIKCPYVLKNVSPCMAQKSMTMKEEKNFFCTFQSDGTLRLKRNHKYYYQIQMQLAICEQKVFDFVIWSQHGMSVERIQMDESFWNHTYPKLLRFHKEYLVPEYFLMRIPRELESAKFEY